MTEETQKKEQNQDAPLKDKVMAAVKSGQLKMRPRWYFVLRAMLLTVGVLVAAMASLYTASLLLFVARETGIWVAPAFGWHGVMVFLFSLPWVLILLVLLFIAILEILVSRYSFAYRMPLIYSGLAVLFLVGAGGLLVATTPLHRNMAQCPPEGGPPPCAMGFYRDLDPERHKNIHEGVISRVTGQNFVITNRRSEELMIVVTPRTRLPFGADFAVGDKIVVVGDRNGYKVEAFGIGFFERDNLVPRH